ncbi:hypothetical protein SEA_RANA_45 [Streptomyces phage Rana]|uniref:Uncharacterized protein n=1 Tax=Streptomyces phage Lorelei TaxID=1873996 RepID=A0A1C9LWI7_9CAUD|nr:hypothetical protein KGH01_gp45 [Streptomyces phage Lorelei]AOQ26941.1 hypothetical protein SEA_LORELEI_45 [Streptomyces phage Lorelei]AWN07263.1 hypothetical protein SEA_RANA_45 [Streptomyces phage Rana]AWN07339.1 hypothetical protein SEA_NABI_45 [Streptomyces phage Nabi]
MKFIDIEDHDYEHAEEARVDWSVVSIPEVEDAAKSAAYYFARDYDFQFESEDMLQELLIELAQRPAMVREALEMENSRTVLITRFYRLLRSKFKHSATNLQRHRSFEAEQAKFNPEVS